MTNKRRNIAVVFTEYQLLQAEAIVYTQNLSSTVLILGENSRIPKAIINKKLFEQIVESPSFSKNGSLEKLSYQYPHKVISYLKELLRDFEIEVLIGAADENIFFSIFKEYSQPKKYWNIEDGMGNYRKFSWLERVQSIFKNILFILYGFNFRTHAQKGSSESDEKFRINPSLSIAISTMNLKDIINNYLLEYSNHFKDMVPNYKRFSDKQYLIVTKEGTQLTNQSIIEKAIIKPHPKFAIKNSDPNYFHVKVPIEVLPAIFSNIRYVIYDSYYCTSVLNILSIYPYINVSFAFNMKSKYVKDKGIIELYNRLFYLFGNRLIPFQDIEKTIGDKC